MKEPALERAREAVWRGELSPAEENRLQLWLAEHPEASADWGSEKRLTQALGRLRNVPVPSNFTSRVLAEAQRQEPLKQTPTAWWTWRGRLRWLPRIALASVVLAAGLISYQQVQNSNRKDRAESLREIVSYTAIPGPEILQDYEAIQAMSQATAADVELLKALQ